MRYPKIGPPARERESSRSRRGWASLRRESYRGLPPRRDSADHRMADPHRVKPAVRVLGGGSIGRHHVVGVHFELTRNHVDDEILADIARFDLAANARFVQLARTASNFFRGRPGFSDHEASSFGSLD